MRPVHDRGGWPETDPIPREEHEFEPWEKRTDALARVLLGKGLLRVDELRRAVEGLEPRAYEELSYYERWLAGIEGLLVEKEILTRQEVLEAQRGAERGDESTPPRPGGQQHLSLLLDLVKRKGVVSGEEIAGAVAAMEATTPVLGARAVARAWADPAFKELLRSDPRSAFTQLGVEYEYPPIAVLENTEEVHHLVVCTLCSCYPRAVLGLPPSWYKSFEYRSRAVREPRAVLREFGLDLPDEVEIRVVDSSADLRYLVLPRRPPGTDGMGEEALSALVTRDSMIGTGLPEAP